MSIFEWEQTVYPVMHAECTAAGKKAREDGLPRECNLTDPKFVHNGRILRVWKQVWYQGYDGWEIPAVFKQMEDHLKELPTSTAFSSMAIYKTVF